MDSNINCDEEEEDEDVVIAGSELHEALKKMGYSDFEVVPVVPNQESSDSMDSYISVRKKSDGWVPQILYNKFWNIYRCVTKDSKALREQLVTISEAQYLLDDHAELIKNILDENSKIEKSGINSFLSCLQYAGIATAGYYFINRSNPFTWLVTLPALTIAKYKYTKWRTDRDLKRLILEQTELYYAYKRAMRILNHSFRMNAGAKQSGFKFTDLGAEKLKYLQSITEKTVKSLGTMSTAYYETTLRMVELLPDSYRQDFDSQITYFDKECFMNCGEITYNGLKQLYYRFLLIQSEMLVSLAVLRNTEPKDLSDEIKRGMKIDLRVEQLLKLTTKHRISMMKMVDNFQKHKLNPVENKHRGFHGSKWQDLYIRLHLATHKMQKAYDNIACVLDGIENHIDRRTDETELMDMLKVKLDEVCNDVDKARDLALLSSLIILKMGRFRLNGDEKNVDDDKNAVEISRRDIPVIRDTDPEIIDEVFEEYIRERYSETLSKEVGDDYLEKTYKLDKLLSKNLMSELKEALIDKQKDTRERESRALKRMNRRSSGEELTAKNVETTNAEFSEDPSIGIESRDAKQCLRLESTNGSSRDEAGTGTRKLDYIPMPPPPPMPKEYGSPRKEFGEVEPKIRKSNCIPMPPPPPIPKEVHQQLRKEIGEVEELDEQRSKCFVPLPGSGAMPVSLFLYNEEETFIGSGENSDDELVVDQSTECEEGDEGKEKEEKRDGRDCDSVNVLV